MRVLHVIPSIALDQGGPSFVLRQMVTGLSSAGVEVEVATTSVAQPREEAAALDLGVKSWTLPPPELVIYVFLAIMPVARKERCAIRPRSHSRAVFVSVRCRGVLGQPS